MCWPLRVLIGLALWCATATIASADKRVALVIGNSDYQNAVKLANPGRDAAAIADMFKGAGFDVVEMRRDLAAAEMRRVVRDFSAQAQSADVAVVYFAGHGVEVDGGNYLIPTDAKLDRDIDVEDEAVSLDRVLRMIEPAKRLRVVILDACRDNPFLKSMQRTLATRAIGRGLARIDPPTSDTLIAFAAKAGSTAIDGDGEHSPFTISLLKNLPVPGLDVRLAFGRVRDQVLEATGRRQEPFVYGSLGGDAVALVPTSEPKQVEAAPPAVVNPTVDERQDYEMAERLGTVGAWESFLAIHGAGFFADVARGHLAKLNAAGTEPAPQVVRPAGTVQPVVKETIGTVDKSEPHKAERTRTTHDPPAAKGRAGTKKQAEPRHARKDEEERRRTHKDAGLRGRGSHSHRAGTGARWDEREAATGYSSPEPANAIPISVGIGGAGMFLHHR